MLFSSEFVEQVQFRAQILVFAQWRETLDFAVARVMGYFYVHGC
jgi:hypothetical protein